MQPRRDAHKESIQRHATRHRWLSAVSMEYRRTLVSTKTGLSPVIDFVPLEPLGGIDTGYGLDLLPAFVGLPILVGAAHLVFEHAADEFRDGCILLGCLTACPPESLILHRHRDVL